MMYFIPWVVFLLLVILSVPIAAWLDKRKMRAAYAAQGMDEGMDEYADEEGGESDQAFDDTGGAEGEPEDGFGGGEEEADVLADDEFAAFE